MAKNNKMKKHKFNSGDTVKFAGILYKVRSYKLNGLTGVEYDVEELFPSNNGFYVKHFGLPQSILQKV